MQCQNCGNVNRQGVKFCAKCGKALGQVPAAPQYAPPQQPPPGYAPPAPPSPSPLLQPQMQQPVTPYPAAMPQQYSPVAAPRKLPLDKIGIGCGGMFLGLLCGILSTVGVIYGPDLVSGTKTPTTAPLNTPAPIQSPIPKPGAPTPSPKPSAFNHAPGDPATAFVATRVNDRVLVLNDATRFVLAH